MRKQYRLDESEMREFVRNLIRETVNELDWRTYANAARGRMKQMDGGYDPKVWKSVLDLNRAANKSFNDEYVGDLQYDTMGDKMAGSRSNTIDLVDTDFYNNGFAKDAVKGRNKGGDTMFSLDKDRQYSSRGITTPSKFFKDKEVAGAYKKANDAMWDYQDGKYDYDSEHGWHKIDEAISRTIRKVLFEDVDGESEVGGGDEFEFGDSREIRPGSHQQVIIYRGEEIGFLTTREKNWLAPLEEIYALPDVDAGITPPDDPDNNNLLDGKEGWIDFKTFMDYDEAFNYAKNNFDQIVYLFQNGDWD